MVSEALYLLIMVFSDNAFWHLADFTPISNQVGRSPVLHLPIDIKTPFQYTLFGIRAIRCRTRFHHIGFHVLWSLTTNYSTPLIVSVIQPRNSSRPNTSNTIIKSVHTRPLPGTNEDIHHSQSNEHHHPAESTASTRTDTCDAIECQAKDHEPEEDFEGV